MPPEEAFDYEATLAACARGQGAALQRLYTQESPRLLGVVQRIVRNLPQAEDIVHDAFVNIWNRAGSYQPGKGSARGWIYTVARNLALNAVRDGAREVDVPDEAWAALDAETSMAAWRHVEDQFEWQDTAGRMGLCLERLEPVRRNCVLHAYLDGLSHAEIAQRVDAPLGTVKAWIKRSLTALKECLQ
ncbi:sigma-70 family RNA polymerase sigma factor [Curvibacter sp. RS43]|jgi:RNA polymerase sigma factor (sigma-70 family)|uniref:Sigma-70 family RNA polymerase sigma factor n=1 Tax=Curvibacter microcysteis TaxID=3026419 RepID=A0ABT5MEX7_9BURK|nr:MULTISPECIES: sigma-70 family RNA polymerase sigma factor [unclassified Curvibacter]MDD0809958.1 sigma-70 family RNA polymerase sigma factor [Curvibacter sp. RS43]MDD0815133.1 sigma-70 family RNA polymerase sigma factor [Curvibacter sp. HBC28]